MKLDGLHAAAPNLCNICIDRAENGECSGRLYHYYQLRPQKFSSQGEVFRLIDQLCDRLNYPQCSDQLRSFSVEKTVPDFQEKVKVARQMSKEKLLEQKGEKATFVVHVMYRQNATWQGSVTWTEKKQTANFRSALELIKLMDSAVEATHMADGPEDNTL